MVCAIFMRLGLSFSSFSWWLLNIFFNCFFVCVSCRFIPLYTVLGSGWISIYLFTLLFCCIGTFFRSLLYTCHANMRIPNRYICQWCNLLNLVRKKRSVLWMDGMMMARSEAFTIPWHSSPLMLEAHTNEWRSEIACSTLYRKCNIMTRDWQWHDLHLRNCSSFCIRMTRRFLLAFYLIFFLAFFIHIVSSEFRMDQQKIQRKLFIDRFLWFFLFLQLVHWIRQRNVMQLQHASAKLDTIQRRQCTVLAWHRVNLWQSCRNSPIFCNKLYSKCASKFPDFVVVFFLQLAFVRCIMLEWPSTSSVGLFSHLACSNLESVYSVYFFLFMMI